jgi:adenine deaminase
VAELRLENARVVDVRTGTVTEGPVAVEAGRIVEGAPDAERVLDLDGAYVLPA